MEEYADMKIINELKFWKYLAIALLIMSLVELVGLHKTVTKLEQYVGEVNYWRNQTSFLKHQHQTNPTNYVHTP